LNASVAKFQRVLAALPEATQKPIKEAVTVQAHVLAEAMRSAAHRGETGNLAKSIRVTPSRFPNSALVRAGGPLTTTGGPGNQGFVREFLRAVRGTDRPYDYALANEFGTEKMPARPFFWPTYRAHKRRIRKELKAVAVEAINQIVPLEK
jgi:HK97 gp10 family phage protein